MIDLSADLASWMAAGGDGRQVPDPHTGLTKYRTTTTPRSGVALGSCTASWPTQGAFRAAQLALEGWRREADPSDALHAAAHEIRERLARLLGLGPESELVLTPSGTDAVYLVSALCLRDDAPVHHVVVGASELGGGTLAAARGEVFNPLTPHGGPAEVGAPVAGLSGRCSAEPLYLRDRAGERLSPDEIDERVRSRVQAALAEGARVIVHLVAHSKTGLRAPSLRLAESLVRERGERVVVLVDAAQGRVAPHDVRNALRRGFIVLFTGSKFYSGPPFSGVLCLPQRHPPPALPAGLQAWTARSDLPPHWTAARDALRVEHNPGLLLRWIAALEQITRYHAIPPQKRGRVYHTFASAVLERFGPSEILQIDVPLPPVHHLVTGLGAYPSVFGFHVIANSEPLPAPALRRLHAHLDDPRGPTPRFHLGQPVALGPPTDEAPAVLRVALGAQLVIERARDPDAGAAWFREHLGVLRERLEGLVRSGAHLSATESS
ncbi:MAG: hypothetical protein EA397_13750 [Deltaproteobacteria bacterium]|nr:MAG: hypothetical protein EA397_13750 [Deltaproteobacteria bacterium]